MKIPILTYHSTDIAGGHYADNDLVAFASDLDAVTSMGFEIIALSRLVDEWLRDCQGLRLRRLVAFTCDDGSDFDYYDLPHPVAGRQRSMFNVLRDFRENNPREQPGLALTSFVIVSPEARATLDRTCLIGRGWWTDGWWELAVASGLVEIASHSWDHNHPTLPPGPLAGVPRGTFASIASEALAEHEIAAAQGYLASTAPNPGLALFAYPYGETNAFLIDDYFPRKAAPLGLRAAFTTRPGYLDPECNRWSLPRFIFRRDWRDPAGLKRILDEAVEA